MGCRRRPGSRSFLRDPGSTTDGPPLASCLHQSPQMPDEYARTERGAPVFDLDEVEAKAAAEAAKPPREIHGPAWAGTLAGSTAPVAEPIPNALPVFSPRVEAHNNDAARTVLDQRVAPVPRIQPPPPRGQGTDMFLRLGLMLLAASIILIAVGLLLAVALT
jgi:hypothetical protein